MEHETRSMVGLLYVLKDETCGKCGSSGKVTLYGHHSGKIKLACPDCDGKGYRTFKIELSDALRRVTPSPSSVAANINAVSTNRKDITYDC